MKTLAEQNPETYERLKASRPNIAKLMTIFKRPSEIDQALGINVATSHWVAGRNSVSNLTENCARLYLEAAKVEPVGASYLYPVQDECAEDKGSPERETTFLVVAPADKADKVSKVLEMMGCQMVEV